MKIMDEKGKLFGKLNIIDLLVILLVIAAAVLFIWRRAQPSEPEETKFELTYQVRAIRVDPATYEVVKQYVDPERGLKDQMFSTDSNNKMLDAYVVDCVATPHVEYLATSNGDLKRVESSGDDQRLDLVFTIQAWATDAITNQVGIQQIRAGAGHYVKTPHFEFSGSILTVDWMDQ